MSITTNKEYIKSPLNYVGGKYKLLEQIIPQLPNNINTFVDMFGGGFNVGINVKANKHRYHDVIPELIGLFQYFKKTDESNVIEKVERLTDKYKLNKTTYENSKEGYLQLRSDYNNNPSPDLFYTLITCSFSNQIRFNSKRLFNMPYGDRYFNPVMKNNLIDFVNKLHEYDVVFELRDFRQMDIESLEENDFIYCDPPYFNSLATYNENGGWTEKDEVELLAMLDTLHNKGYKFALSNNLKYDNPLLEVWKDKYNTRYLNIDYNNCNYQKKNKSKDIEVLITNY